MKKNKSLMTVPFKLYVLNSKKIGLEN